MMGGVNIPGRRLLSLLGWQPGRVNGKASRCVLGMEIFLGVNKKIGNINGPFSRAGSPCAVRCCLCVLLGSTRWHKETTLSKEHPWAAQAPRSAPASMGCAAATGRGLQRSCRTPPWGLFPLSSSGISPSAQKVRAECAAPCSCC